MELDARKLGEVSLIWLLISIILGQCPIEPKWTENLSDYCFASPSICFPFLCSLSFLNLFVFRRDWTILVTCAGWMCSRVHLFHHPRFFSLPILRMSCPIPQGFGSIILHSSLFIPQSIVGLSIIRFFGKLRARVSTRRNFRFKCAYDVKQRPLFLVWERTYVLYDA